MTNKEMYELIAKALGLEGFVAEDWNGIYFCVPGPEPKEYRWADDDGDALRLAVDLQINVSVGERSSWAESIHLTDTPDLFVEWFKGGCKYAATRRAITRAAAEIGKHG